MALIHNNITVGTTATVLAQIPNGVGKVQVSVYNNDNSSIFVGDSAITVTAGSNQGLTVPKSTIVQFTLSGNDVLYGISSSGTSTGAVVVMYSA
jgi:hypothetical protein